MWKKTSSKTDLLTSNEMNVEVNYLKLYIDEDQKIISANVKLLS